MGRMTIELIRKRSEHNEGDIQTLEELALHQEKLEKIENLDKWCRGLRVLLLQSNNISKIENLSRLKCLEYLNLALNNIETVENLEGCESLRKLDLTLNFIGEISSIGRLRENEFLEQLYLTGNPCTDFPNYRDYVIATLPQIRVLDGIEILKSERIKAIQLMGKMQGRVHDFEENHKEKREFERNIPLGGNIEDDDFWTRTTENTPEARSQLQKRLEYDDEKKSGKSGKDKEEPKTRKLFADDGRPFNVNEAKYSFSLHDDVEGGTLVVELDLPRFLDSSLIHADVQPNYVRVLIKKKIFQLCLPEEVKPDSSCAQRSKTTGHLLVRMPKLDDQNEITELFRRKPDPSSKSNPLAKKNLQHQKQYNESESALSNSESQLQLETKQRNTTSSRIFAEDEVPPLV